MTPRRAPAPQPTHCRHCRHIARPGRAWPGYCGERTDTPPAYGPGHPLHRLPEDFGASCEFFEAWH